MKKLCFVLLASLATFANADTKAEADELMTAFRPVFFCLAYDVAGVKEFGGVIELAACDRAAEFPLSLKDTMACSANTYKQGLSKFLGLDFNEEGIVSTWAPKIRGEFLKRKKAEIEKEYKKGQASFKQVNADPQSQESKDIINTCRKTKELFIGWLKNMIASQQK